MGVTGSGKTTLGRLLAPRLGVLFRDADDFHSPANRAKMAANVPLDDADRWPWLETLATAAVEWEAAGGAVLACSALKRSYRDVLFRSTPPPHPIMYLEIDYAEAKARLDRRRGHHPLVSQYDHILAGQFRDLEVPGDAIVVPATLEPSEQVERALAMLPTRSTG
jgi:carbohydrate kinase (thermoresistant glucokinase family)